MLIWASDDQPRLGQGASRAILSLENDVYVSAATAWELSIKLAQGKLFFPIDEYAETLTRLSFLTLQITPAHGIAAGRLPRHHGDPFDRMLIAQAMVEGLTLVTDDSAISRYDVSVLPARA